MDSRNNAQQLGAEILGPTGRDGGDPHSPRHDHDHGPIEPEILDLKGGVLDGLPATAIPLEAFHLEEIARNEAYLRGQTDSIAPTAHASIAPEPQAPHPSRKAWIVPCAVAAGLAGIVAAATFLRPAPTAPTAASPAAAVAPPAALVERVPLPTAEPPPPSLPAADPMNIPAAGPRPTPAKALVAHPAPIAAGVPQAAAKAGPPGDDPSDLPLVIPPLPPPSQVAMSRPAAAVAIAAAGRRAASCRDPGGDPISVPVVVTFSSSGRATAVRVTGGPLLGTTEGGCVAAALRTATVPPFDGDPIEVTSTVHLR